MTELKSISYFLLGNIELRNMYTVDSQNIEGSIQGVPVYFIYADYNFLYL